MIEIKKSLQQRCLIFKALNLVNLDDIKFFFYE